MTTSTNELTITSANDQEIERLRAYLTAIADGGVLSVRLAGQWRL